MFLRLSLLVFIASRAYAEIDRSDVQASAEKGGIVEGFVPSWHPRRVRRNREVGSRTDSQREGGYRKEAAESGSPSGVTLSGGDASLANAQAAPGEAGLSSVLEVSVPERGMGVTGGGEATSAAEVVEGSAAGGARVPSWWECALCFKCELSPMAERPIGIEDNSVPSCPKCWGCTHRLDLLNLTATWHGQDRNIRMHPGNTGASIFLATRFDGTEAVFKVHGIRTSQVSEAKLAQMDRVYKGRHYSLKEQSTVRYVSSMAEECGLGHINIKEWFEPLRAVFAVTGEKVEERNGIMARRARYPEFVTITRVACCAEYARGASVEMLTLRLTTPEILEAIYAVPHRLIRDAALFDVLFGQGDRHSENAFMAEDGYLKLIDTRDSHLAVDGIDSMFVPSTYAFYRHLVGNEFVYNKSFPWRTHHWQQNTMDYRCHVPGGKLGTNYPKRFLGCITKWAGMTPEELEAEYGISAAVDPEHAAAGTSAAERQRRTAETLLRFGFEEGLLRIKHNNATGRVPGRGGFELTEPCCKVELCGGEDHEYPAYPPHGECGRATDFKCSEDGREVLPEDFQYPPLPGLEVERRRRKRTAAASRRRR